MMRQLTSEEKAINDKAIRRMEEDLEYQKYLLDHANLMLTKGIRLNYLRSFAEYRLKKRDCCAAISKLEQDIQLLHTQNRDGVKKKR